MLDAVYLMRIQYYKLKCRSSKIEHSPKVITHPAETSIISDICNLSNISDIAPLTLGSMEKSFFYHLFCVTKETYLSKDLGKNIYRKN